MKLIIKKIELNKLNVTNFEKDLKELNINLNSHNL